MIMKNLTLILMFVTVVFMFLNIITFVPISIVLILTLCTTFLTAILYSKKEIEILNLLMWIFMSLMWTFIFFISLIK